MAFKFVAERWLPFLQAIDATLQEKTELCCFGGSAIAAQFGLSRTTADIDLIEVPPSISRTLIEVGGLGTPLAKRHGVYFDIVAGAIFPYEYDTRLVQSDLPDVTHLKLHALEKHDIVLSKLSRGIERDWEDVKYLATTAGLDTDLLEKRFQEELGNYCTKPDREEQTLELWIEEINRISRR